MTELICKIFLKNADPSDAGAREKYGTLAGTVGILLNFLLCAVKIAASVISGSVAMIADALNNLSDAGGQVISIISFKLSSKPADREHPYGHARFEYIASLAVSFLIIYIGIELLSTSVKRIFNPVETKFELVSAIVCVTNVIPVFGPFIGAIPSFFIIFIKDPSKAFIFLIIILIIQQIDGNIIGPKILGDSTGMSSLGVMVAILIMGHWLGVIGMILGVPIFAVILAIVNEIAENKLRQKNLPVNTAEYYSSNAEADIYTQRETISHAVFSFAGDLFGRLFNLIFKRKKTSEAESDEKENNDQKEE